MAKRRLPHTFPHRIVLASSLILCICALASLVLGVISWTNQLWGYYWGTGFWTCAVVLLTGVLGIVCSYVRNLCLVKSFMIASIFGCLVSLGMLALSAGGLDSGSGFYNGRKGNELLKQICHGGSLGLGVLQLTLCILSDGICIHYLFIEKSAQLYRVKDSNTEKRHKRRSENRQDLGNDRASIRSGTPLIGGSSQSKDFDREKNMEKKKKSKSNKKYPNIRNNSKRNPVGSLRRNGNSNTPSPTRSPCVRSSSFSTFGHGNGATSDRISLVVHPGDNMSVAETTRSHTPDLRPDHENHYAQTMLFEPPLPIEEDEELPPYEAVDSKPYTNIDTQVKTHNETNLRRTNSAPLHGKRRSERKSNRRSLTGSQIPPCRSEVGARNSGDVSNVYSEPQIRNIQVRQSRSVDLLSASDHWSSTSDGSCHQGLTRVDFGRSSPRIENQDIKLRTHSLKFNREKRLDRRNRALSAEIRLNKDQILSQGASIGSLNQGLVRRSSSIDGSNSGLFAGSRIIPTKFSLRTPVRQMGMPHVRSAVPVKSITSLPLFLPPRKPPRTHSVTLKDFDHGDIPNVDLDKCDFIDTPLDLGCVHNSNIKDTKENDEYPVDTSKSAKDENNEMHLDKLSTNTKNGSNVFFGEIHAIDFKQEKMSIDMGPVLKCNNNPLKGKNDIDQPKEAINAPNNDCRSSSYEPKMSLPCSPILIRPSIKEDIKENAISSPSEGLPIFAEELKQIDNSPKPKIRKSRQHTQSVTVSYNSANDKDGFELKTIAHQHVIEDKIMLSVTDPCCISPPTDHQQEGMNVEHLRDLHVRLPPLSPSERILQRKKHSSPACNDTADMPEKVNNVIVKQMKHEAEAIDINTDDKGARPKVYRNLKNGQHSGSSIPVPKKRWSLSNIDKDESDPSTTQTKGNGNNSDNRRTVSFPSGSNALLKGFANALSNTNTSSTSRSTVPRTKDKPASANISTNTIPSSSSGSVHNQSSSGVQNSSADSVVTNMPANNFHNLSPYGIQNRQVATAVPTAAASQGVLRLPQSHYSRHVADSTRRNTSAMPQINAQPLAQNQNVGQQNNPQQNNNDSDRPLFSILL